MAEYERVEVSPMDKFNTELIENVHPADWSGPEPAKRYNLVVIGAGTAGLVAVAGAAGLGSLSRVIHPYPTQAEAIKKVADAFSRTRLTPAVKKLLSRWLAWQRE